MKFGAFFVRQRPQLHEQYDDEHKANSNPVNRTDVEVYVDILKGTELAEELGFDSIWIVEHAFSEHSIISSPHSLHSRPNQACQDWRVLHHSPMVRTVAVGPRLGRHCHNQRRTT